MSSLLKSCWSPGAFFVIPSIIFFKSATVLDSLASRKMVVFLRRTIRNTSMIECYKGFCNKSTLQILGQLSMTYNILRHKEIVKHFNFHTNLSYLERKVYENNFLRSLSIEIWLVKLENISFQLFSLIWPCINFWLCSHFETKMHQKKPHFFVQLNAGAHKWV